MTFGAWIPWDLDIAHAWDRAEAKREQRSRRKTNALYRRLARQRVTALQAQIAALQAAGSGATADQITSLEASATEIDTDVKALHDGLNPPAP